MKIINKTPHPLNFYRAEQTEEILHPVTGEKMRVAREGEVPFLTIEQTPPAVRCAVSTIILFDVSDDNTGLKIPLSSTEIGEVENPPDEEDGTIYVVSLIARQAAGRGDFWSAGYPVRDLTGKVIGAIGLSC